MATVTEDNHLPPNNPPDYAIDVIPIAKFGSITTSARLWAFKATKGYKIVDLRAAPTTISSGTLKVDLLINGTTVMSTKATATVADTPVAGVFSSTTIASGDFVLVATTSDSSTVTDVLGHLLLRPLLGKERM